ncbi:MAG TPA: ATP-dependent Clp protease adapter ClpS [Beutenbergiaceae bacterium]|nr:ATP-dependent Clp protease adapter ClpS [Beutenbergiaceae bacterium]
MSVASPEQKVAEDPLTEHEPEWNCVVWDDPVNLMTYVTYVFQTYFGYSEPQARSLMLKVHHEGKAIVASGGRETIEMDVQAMHSYGLWATMETV